MIEAVCAGVWQVEKRCFSMLVIRKHRNLNSSRNAEGIQLCSEKVVNDNR